MQGVGASYRSPLTAYAFLSPLTHRAIKRRPLPLLQFPDRRSARMARLTRAAVDEVLVLKVPRAPVAADVVAQRAAARADRCLQRFLHLVGEHVEARSADPMRRATGLAELCERSAPV